jgi:hypothetical protein
VSPRGNVGSPITAPQVIGTAPEGTGAGVDMTSTRKAKASITNHIAATVLRRDVDSREQAHGTLGGEGGAP